MEQDSEDGNVGIKKIAQSEKEINIGISIKILCKKKKKIK